ncbi:MAG: DUF4389 domain-containing protein, partial [Candidatus Diapherotrites archaeon]|nr:DUF4389 domain-containing protein [Candidatus Diapherotrites archaeon]
RLVYWIPLVIVATILGILAAIALLVSVLTVLVLGKRYKALTNLIAMSLVYKTAMGAYYTLLTDERPPIIPKGV